MGKKLKVLQLGKFYPIMGGVEKVMYDLTLGLAELPQKMVDCEMMCAADGVEITVHLNVDSCLIC